jgi:formylmethanofuran dehydrogenase subunit E
MNCENCGEYNVPLKPMWEDDTGMMMCDLCFEVFNHE